MENQEIQETPDQRRIRALESELFNIKKERDNLSFVNQALGYSTRLLSEFHLSLDDKSKLADALDSAKDPGEIKDMYEKFNVAFFNKALNEDSADFQWSPGFKENLRQYFAVSLGYDIISEIRDSFPPIVDYFALENKLFNTPEGALRKPMTEKLLGDRENMLISMDKIINIINSFNEGS